MPTNKNKDNSVTVTQMVQAGSSDLFATMPWVARLNPKQPRPICEGHRYGANKHCKARATLVYIDLANKVHFLCGSHAHTDFISEWSIQMETPEGLRVRKWFDKACSWTVPRG